MGTWIRTQSILQGVPKKSLPSVWLTEERNLFSVLVKTYILKQFNCNMGLLYVVFTIQIVRFYTHLVYHIVNFHHWSNYSRSDECAMDAIKNICTHTKIRYLFLHKINPSCSTLIHLIVLMYWLLSEKYFFYKKGSWCHSHT